MSPRLKSMLMVAGIILPFAITLIIVRTQVNLSELERTNQGELLIPHIQWPALQVLDEQQQPYPVDNLTGRWSLVYFADGHCDTRCKNATYYLMRQFRLGLGEDASRVRRIVVHTATPNEELRHFLDNHADGNLELFAQPDTIDEQFADVLAQPASVIGELFFMSPDGQIFLRYQPSDAMEDTLLEADKMLKDIKRTLKGSIIG